MKSLKIESNILRKVGVSILGLLIIVYVIYQSFLINSVAIKTETALYSQLPDTVEVQAWFVRAEETLSHSNNQSLSFEVEDGEKLSKGDVLARAFANEKDAVAQRKIKRLDEEIASLELLSDVSKIENVDVENVGSQINNSISNMLIHSSNNEFDEVLLERDSAQYYLNLKNVSNNKEQASEYQQLISDLKVEREQIKSTTSGSIETIVSPISGFYSSSTDGYEYSFDYDNIEDVTVTQINNIQKSQVTDDVFGKISTEFVWYMVGVINEEQKISIEKKDDIEIFIPSAMKERVPAKVEAINKDTKTGLYSLVLSCDYNSFELSSIRNETVQIVMKDYNGVLVNEDAIHFKDITKMVKDENGVEVEKTFENVKGVYVKFGQTVSFVQIFTDVTINGYAICRIELSEEDKEKLVTKSSIKLYDEVIVSGENLYDGKIL